MTTQVLEKSGSNDLDAYPEKKPIKNSTHPARPEHPKGTIYRRYLKDLDVEFSLRVMERDLDIDQFHRWMNMKAIAKFWERAESKEKVYEYLKGVENDPHQFSVIGYFNDQAFGYFEIYWALEDVLGQHYPVGSYDRGTHLLVGNPQFLGTEYSKAWITCISEYIFEADQRTQDIFGEPRADNLSILRYGKILPFFEVKDEIELPNKTARLVQINRDKFFQTREHYL